MLALIIIAMAGLHRRAYDSIYNSIYVEASEAECDNRDCAVPCHGNKPAKGALLFVDLG